MIPFMKHLPPLIGIFLSTPALASTIFCHADFDEGSHYELTAEGANAGFRYSTNDGIDLHADLKTSRSEISENKFVVVNAANENMGATVNAAFDAANGTYLGKMGVTFDLQHADPLELDASCSVK
jgi:hypothetical protein